jgi:hypothetical protein
VTKLFAEKEIFMIKKLIPVLGLLSLALWGCLIVPVPARRSGIFVVRGDFIADGPHVQVLSLGGGVYRALRFEAGENPVIVYRIVVLYRNGERVDYPVNWAFTRGDWDRTVQIDSYYGRRVDSVQVYYRPASGFEGRQAFISVYGLP